MSLIFEYFSGGGREGVGGGGGGGGICPQAPVERGHHQDVIKKKLSCLTFDEERVDKLMMSCRLRNCRNRQKKISGKLKLSGAQGRKHKAKEEEEAKKLRKTISLPWTAETTSLETTKNRINR